MVDAGARHGFRRRGLVFLQRFNIRRQVGDPLLHLGGMSLTHTPKYRAPNRHFFAAVCRRRAFSAEHTGNVEGRKLAVVILAEGGQVSWGCFESTRRWASALAVTSMARSTIVRIHLLSGRSGRQRRRNMFYGRLLRRGAQGAGDD